MNRLNNGFRPELYTHVTNGSRNILDAWQVTTSGIFIPGPADHYTALWHGRRYDRRDETVSLVMAMPEEHHFPEGVEYSTFYFGVVVRSIIEKAGNPIDAFIDAAIVNWRPDPADNAPLERFIATVNCYIPAPPLQEPTYA